MPTITAWVDDRAGGGLAEVSANDWIVMPYPFGGEIYSIKEDAFAKTYRRHRPLQIPTKDELIAEWVAVLQNEAVYRKTKVVFAKPILSDGVIQKINDETMVELWVGGLDDDEAEEEEMQCDDEGGAGGGRSPHARAWSS